MGAWLAGWRRCGANEGRLLRGSGVGAVVVGGQWESGLAESTARWESLEVLSGGVE